MSIGQLQNQIELLTDEINDIFHATQLNFDAIKIHLQIDDDESAKKDQKNLQPSQIKNNITQCESQFKALKNAYKQRTNLRLEYLINQQIKSEEQKVRRQRLLEYEDKIYDHRRLICDKESFYDSLIKPKMKRPSGMTIEQYQEYKLKEVQNEERENFKQLEEETQILVKLEKFLRIYRLSLEDEFHKYQDLLKEEQRAKQQQDIKDEKKNKTQYYNEQKQKEIQQPQLKQQQQSLKPSNDTEHELGKQQQKAMIKNLLQSTPTMYSKFQTLSVVKMTPEAFKVSKKQLQQCLSLQEDEIQLVKEYNEEREMWKYLQWEHSDLIRKYKQIQDQIKQLRSLDQPPITRKKL